MNPAPRPPERIPIVSETELIPLTIPLDRPEPVQSELAIALPELQPQPKGNLARDDDDWK
jgi:hypothetical protein